MPIDVRLLTAETFRGLKIRLLIFCHFIAFQTTKIDGQYGLLGAAAKILSTLKKEELCSVHFVDDCFDRDLKNELLGLPIRRMLKYDSFPTKCLPYESSPVKSLCSDVRAKNVLRGSLLIE